MRSSGRHNKLYNYLVNQFKLSEEKILEAVYARVEQILEKHINQLFESKRFEKMILDRVNHIVQRGLNDKYVYWSTETFEKFFRETVNKVVKEKIDSMYKIEIKAEEK
jgi:hypothetical protein